MTKLRNLHLVGATGQIRTAEFNHIEHIVVPVVAMVEGVVWAVNSEYPEFVAAEELALSPQQWDGRPAFADHPEDGGAQVTGNTPRILEQSFGTIFHTVSAERILQTRKLEFEVYLDPVKAATISARAAAVCDRLLAGKVVEVSVGSYVVSEKKEGEFNGKRYLAKWTDIVSDHIAFLEEGAEGACSVAAGCGAPRTAIRHLISAEGIRREDVVEPKKRSLKERFMQYLAQQGLISAQNLSDQDVRSAIDTALRAVEPGYMGIDCVFPDEGKVVYYVAPADEWKTFRRGYTITDGNVATLTDNAEEVEAVMTYEPVVTAAASAQPKAACGCGGQHPATPGEGERNMLTKEARAAAVAALIAIETNPLKDAKAYDGMEEATLESLAAHYRTAAPTPAVVPPVAAPAVVPPVAAAVAEVPAVQSEAEFLAAHPAIKSIVDQHQAREVAEKNALIASLVAASSVLTEAQLKEKSIGDLKTLAAFAKIEAPAAVDFSGQAVPRAATGGQDFTPPNSYAPALAALKGSKAVN